MKLTGLWLWKPERAPGGGLLTISSHCEWQKEGWENRAGGRLSLHSSHGPTREDRASQRFTVIVVTLPFRFLHKFGGCFQTVVV